MNYAVLEGSEIWRVFATKKLAELFGGYVNLISTENIGSIFEIYLPIRLEK